MATKFKNTITATGASFGSLTVNGQAVTGGGGGGGLTDLLDIDFKSAYSTYYHEISYNSGDVSSIDIWTDINKGTKLFTKVFTYQSGDLTQIVTTDEISNATLTKVFTYDVDGNLEKITRTYA